ncbi:MAG TPA: hypothetical protein VFK16_04375 [Gemmatimonadaceae bacterium]|nr:hypothetical protein [Gemmatimonadaceae bacterium]
MTALAAAGRSARARRAAPALLGVIMTALALALGAWLAERPLARSHGADYQHPPRPTGDAAAGVPALVAVDGRAHVPPGDAAHPAAFAVHVADADTPAGAILRLQQLGPRVPAGTYAPASNQGRWTYAVYAGAFTSDAEARTLLVEMRARGQLGRTDGTVDRRSLALLIAQDIAGDSAETRVAQLRARGLPVYALRQADGRAWLYAGAFAPSDTAGMARLTAALHAVGLRATMAYRTGRSF